MNWRNLKIYEGDLDFLTAKTFKEAGLIACDIETDGEEDADRLDFARGSIATMTLYAPDKALALVRISPQKTPGWVSALLWDRNVTKIFHHAMFDLRFCIYQWGMRPENVLCTKVAAKMLGYPHAEQSLAPQLALHLGVEVDKSDAARSQALSNWRAPKLSDAQLHYASEDVVHLPDLYAEQEQLIRAKNLLTEYRAACAWLPSCAWLEVAGHDTAALFTY